LRPEKLRNSIFQKVAGAGKCTGMSPAYVDMMIRSLVENGFLIATAPRKHEITPSGEKFLEGKNKVSWSEDNNGHRTISRWRRRFS